MSFLVGAFQEITKGEEAITPQILQEYCEKIGKPISLTYAYALLRRMEQDGDGTIDQDEYMKYMKTYGQTIMETTLRERFKYFDADGDGIITVKDIQTRLSEGREKPITMEQAQSVMNRLSRQGFLTFEEFKKNPSLNKI